MTQTNVLAIGSDHDGFPYKEQLRLHLTSQGHTVQDCGTFSTEAADYPVHAHAVALKVASGQADAGIIIDGAGIGSAMTANKVKGILAAACYNEALARNSREHNGANVLCLGSDQISLDQAKAIVKTFLASSLSEAQNKKRVAMIREIECEDNPQKPAPHTASTPMQKCIKKKGDLNVSASGIQPAAQRVPPFIAPHPDSGHAASEGQIGPFEMARFIDHTLLKPEASLEDIRKLCEEATKFNFWSVCVNSVYVREAKNLLRGTDVHVCCVVGFPLGATPPEIKAAETLRAIREGVDEVDMVLNIGALKSQDEKLALEDIHSVIQVCRDSNVLSKVILETALLNDEEKIRACELSMKAGADYVKTSTGFSSGGATVHDIALMSRIVAPQHLGVKASGGVRCYEDAMAMISAGATRLGTSAGVAIVEEARAAAEGRPCISKSRKDTY
jgi:deoxyribose-phosphate aldolase